MTDGELSVMFEWCASSREVEKWRVYDEDEIDEEE